MNIASHLCHWSNNNFVIARLSTFISWLAIILLNIPFGQAFKQHNETKFYHFLQQFMSTSFTWNYSFIAETTGILPFFGNVPLEWQVCQKACDNLTWCLSTRQDVVVNWSWVMCQSCSLWVLECWNSAIQLLLQAGRTWSRFPHGEQCHLTFH